MQGTQNPNSARSRSVPLSEHRPDPRGAPPPYAQATAGSSVSVPARLLHQARAAATQARAASSAQARCRTSLRQFVVPSHAIIWGTSFEDALARLRAAPRGFSADGDRDIGLIATTKIRGNDNVVDTRLVAKKLAAVTASRFPADPTRGSTVPTPKIVLDVSITIEGDRNKIVCGPNDSLAQGLSNDAATSPAGDVVASEHGSSSEQITTEQITSRASNPTTTDSYLTPRPTTPDQAGASISTGAPRLDRRAAKRPAVDEPVRRGRGRPRKQPRSE